MQRWSQPVCTCTKARARALRRFRQRAGHGFLHNIANRRVTIAIAGRLQFFFIAKTRSTSGMAAKFSASVCAAHPVTITACPSRLALRAACRACRKASWVTAQPLMMVVFSSPAALANAATLSPSSAFKRQPKFSTRRLIGSFPVKLKSDRAAHQNMAFGLIVNGQHMHIIIVLIEGRAHNHLSGSTRPCVTAAMALAHAPVPQALVRPTPRSHVSRRKILSPASWRN